MEKWSGETDENLTRVVLTRRKKAHFVASISKSSMAFSAAGLILDLKRTLPTALSHGHHRERSLARPVARGRPGPRRLKHN